MKTEIITIVLFVYLKPTCVTFLLLFFNFASMSQEFSILTIYEKARSHKHTHTKERERDRGYQ